MKHVIMAAIKKVADRELFEDGLSADLHARNIDTKEEAFMLGRVDAIREVRETIEAEYARLVKPRTGQAETHDIVAAAFRIVDLVEHTIAKVGAENLGALERDALLLARFLRA